jgi:hypothetical protein
MIDQIERFQKMHRMISSRRTGSPANFARQLNMTERQLYNLLEEMRLLFPIVYDRSINSYYYPQKVEVIIKISNFDEIDNMEILKTRGGCCLYTTSIIFF